MRPSRTLLLAFALLAGSALLLALLRQTTGLPVGLTTLWWLALTLLIAAALVDALRGGDAAKLTVARQLSDSLSLANRNPASVMLQFRGERPLRIEIMEGLPPGVDVEGLPLTLTLEPGAALELRYQLVPRRRGDVEFAPLWLRVTSPWRLWQWRLRRGEPMRCRVFPSFSALSHFATIGLERELGEIGVHQLQRRGQGMEFRQLREFRAGDALRQIDWKATSRYRKPVSRDYQEERDQSLIFLLDCGRRLHSHDGQLSHFDRALNALLLTAQLALRQGDAVGLLTFASGDGNERWLAPRKGGAEVHTLLRHLYDLHSSTSTSDYLVAAQRLLERCSKRALVVLLSDVREEDAEDLGAAVRLLRSRHRVVVACLRDPLLDQLRDAPIRTADEALLWLGNEHYRSGRHALLRRLRDSAVHIVDAEPGELHTALVAQYLQIRRAGAW